MIFPYYWAAHEGNAQSRNDKQILSLSKKIKWRTELPESFASPILSLVGPIFARRDVSFQVVWRTDLEVDVDEHKIIVWSYWPYICTVNDYLNAVFDDVVSLCGSCRNNALPPSLQEKLCLVAILSRAVCEKSFLKKEICYNFCRLPCQIKTYSLGWTVRRALNTISDRNKTETYLL